MAAAFILTVRGNKLYNLSCEITTAVKAKLEAGDVFAVSAKAGVKDASSPIGVLVTVESPSRFVRLTPFTESEARLNAAFSGDTILALGQLEWKELEFCAEGAASAASAPTDSTSQATATPKVSSKPLNKSNRKE